LGGNLHNPDYKQVCRGDTGHAEVVQLEYDDTVITYEILLQKFWSIHDPTQVNRQGADIGTQYRSSIFYHDAQQRCTAENSKKLLNDSGQFNNEIATEIVAASQFYQAEDYHQDYLNKNNLPVCSI
ncbi:Peptide-methionine (S)-S-oxide reductase MsrA, partial [hydrothermal vent metagenome]